MTDITLKRQRIFMWLRGVAFASIMLTFLWGYFLGPLSLNLVWFSVLNSIWFGFSLLLQNADTSNRIWPAGKCALFGMIDAYVIVCSLSLAVASPLALVSTFGAYCLFATAVCGPVLGGISLLAGSCAGLNSLGSSDGSSLHVLIVGAAAFVCGMAWHVGSPILWSAVLQHSRAQDAVSEDPETGDDLHMSATKAMQMQERLTEISRERDEGQERIMELEGLLSGQTQRSIDAGSLPAQTVVAADDQDGAQAARISALEVRLEQSEAQLKAAKFEKNNMATQLETMSRELEAVYSGGEENASAEDDIAAAFAAVAAEKKEKVSA